MGLPAQPDYAKGRVVCETVFRDLHYKDILGKITRIGYCIPVKDFYVVLYGLQCQKGILMDKINQSINQPIKMFRDSASSRVR